VNQENLSILAERLAAADAPPPPPPPDRDLLTIDEVAERIGWSKPTVRKYLPIFRKGGKAGILRRDYEAFLEAGRSPAKEDPRGQRRQ
jgi:hypothetical protein